MREPTAAAAEPTRPATIPPMSFVELITIIVDDYDPAIAFFVDVLGFDLVDDSPSLTNDGRPKRWVVVRPPGAETGILLARADGDRQQRAVGDQMAGQGWVLPAGWTTSRSPTNAWWRRESSSSRRREMKTTDDSPCSETSPATAGTFLGPESAAAHRPGEIGSSFASEEDGGWSR